MNIPSRSTWWELASAGTITCTTLSVLSFWVQGEAARALPIYSGGGAVNVEGVVPGANAAIRVTADRGLVRWQDFSVQAGERFRIEGNRNQSILNVVTGPDASRIAGVVESGPRFLLANPNGIEVLGTGQIIAPSTWLTTGSVREDDWLQQRPLTPGGDVTYPHIQLDRQTAINVEGTVYADGGGSQGHGGEVILLAHDINLASTALISANGASGGGTIHVGGQAHGLGPEPTATRVTVAEGASLQANATKAGDGGEVVVWSEDLTRFAGQIQAQGGPGGGNGGFVEVSGRQQLDFQGLVNTMAPQGRAGTLLLDPTDLTINNASDGNISTNPQVSITPSASPSVLTWSTIQKNLSGSSLVIQTTGSPASGSEAGNITIAASSPDLNLTNSQTLTFEAAGDININPGFKVYSTDKTPGATPTGSFKFLAGSGKSVVIGAGATVSANQVSIQANTITFEGGQVVTTADQAYTGTVVVNNSTNLTGRDVSFSKLVSGGKSCGVGSTCDLTLAFSGVTDLSNGVSGLNNLTVSAGGADTKIAGSLSTTGFQVYNNLVTLVGAATLLSSGVGTDGNIVFADKVDGAYALDVTSSNGGSVSFNGAVGSTTPLTKVSVLADTISLGNVNTKGGQTYLASTQIQLKGALSASTAGEAILMSGKDVNTIGLLTVVGDSSISTNAGKVTLNAVVEDDGSGPASDFTVSTQGNVGTGDIVFGSTIGKSRALDALVIKSDSKTVVAGEIKAGSLETGKLGTILLNGGLVSTTGNQSFENTLILGKDTQLKSSKQSSIIRVHAVDSQASLLNDLTINNTGFGGVVQIYGDVGQGTNAALGDIVVNAGGVTRFGDPTAGKPQYLRAASLTTDASGTLAFDLHGGEIITTGAQTYNDIGGVTLSSDLKFVTTGGTAGALLVAGPIDAAVSTSPNLTIDVTGVATFSGAIGASVPLGTITIDNSYGTRFAGSLAADQLVFQPSNVIPSVSGQSNYLEFLGNLTLTSSLQFNPNQAFNYQSAFDVSLLGKTNVIGGVPGTTFFDNTGLLTIGKAVAGASSTFEGGLQASNSQSQVSLAGLIQAGSAADGIIDLDGVLELRHDNASLSPDPVALKAGVIKLAGSVDSSPGQLVALTLDTSGDQANGQVFLSADVGVNDSLAALATTNSLGSLTIRANSIITNASQSYGEAKTELFGYDLTLRSLDAGTINFGGTLDTVSKQTPVALHVITDGISRFSGAVGSSNPLASLSTANINTGGTTELNGGSIRTLGDQQFGQKVSLGASATLTSLSKGTIAFAETLNGARDLFIDTAGTIQFQKAIGQTTALTSLKTLSTGGAAINGGSITTTGLQSYAGPIILGANTTLASTNKGAITLAGKVDSQTSTPRDLTINTAGLTTLADSVGTNQTLGQLSTDASGDLLLTATTVVTSGQQAFSEGAITVGAQAGNIVILTSTNGDIRLGTTSADHVEGPGGLSISTPSANVVIKGVAGGTTPLDSLLISAKTIDLHDVTTINAQTYNATGTITTHSTFTTTAAAQPISFNGALVLGDDTTVITDEGVVTFIGTVNSDSGNSPRNLIVNTSTTPPHAGGDITFVGDVGTTQALGDVSLVGSGINLIQGLFRALSLSADTTGITKLAGGSITTTNQQAYASPVELLANTTLTSTNKGAISFAKTLTSPTTAYDLAINTSGATIFNGTVGFFGSTAIPLASIHTDAGGTVEFNGQRVQTTGDQVYGENANLGGSLLLQSDQGGAITFSGAVDATSALSSALVINTSGLTTLAGRVGNSASPLTSITTDQPGTVLLSGGSITTLYEQTYNELLGVRLGADTVLTSNGSNGSFYHIWFDGPVDGTTAGQQSLAIYTQGLTHFGEHVGGQVALESVFTDGLPSSTNRVEILANGVTGGLIKTTGSQSYGENVFINSSSGENTRFAAGGPISFAGTVDLDPSGQPGHLTIEAPGASVSFGLDVGLQTPFLTVTVLTGTLNLNAATINVNGWDSLNPNSFNSVQTAAAIALQGTTSVNSSMPGGIEGGSVLNLQNVTANNSRWLVWSYAPWTNNLATPAESLLNSYGVQYQTPYNVTMQTAPYVNGNQFLYLVSNVPPAPPAPEPAFYPFDHLLNVLQPPLDLKPPQEKAPVESLGNYIQLAPAPQPVAWRIPVEPTASDADSLSFSAPLSGEAVSELLLAFSPSELTSDVSFGFGLLAQASGSGVGDNALSQQPTQQTENSNGMRIGSPGAHDYTPASVEFPVVHPSILRVGHGGPSLPQEALGSGVSLQAYSIPRSRLVGFPTSPVRLDDLQISGYQFNSQPYVALSRNNRGQYTPPQGLRLQAIHRKPTGAQALGPDQGLTSLDVVVDRKALARTLPAEAPTPVLERVTIAVPTVFGTVINIDVPTADLGRAI